MNLFYSSRIEEKSAFLTDEEHRHCTKVLRFTVGKEIVLTNGKGTKFHATIHQINKKDTELLIHSKVVMPITARSLHLAISLPKSSNRVDFLIEKLVEIGIQEITPIITDHSERKKLNIDRYRKKIISASTQSLKYYFPVLHELTSLQKFLETSPHDQILLAHFNKENDSISSLIKNQRRLIVMVGPEGDFSKTELITMKELGIQTVNLSIHRLRTETAAIVACTLVNACFSALTK